MLNLTSLCSWNENVRFRKQIRYEKNENLGDDVDRGDDVRMRIYG